MRVGKRQGSSSNTETAAAEKKDFTSLLTIISLSIIMLITILVSGVSIANLRIVSYNTIDSSVQDRMDRLSKLLETRFQSWVALIEETANSAAPIMAQEPVDQEALRRLFRRITDSQTDAWHIYGSNNLLWTEPGGYLVYSNGTTPSPGFNNTTRNWFIGAKARPGAVSFAEPYIADSTGQLTTAVSTNVYDPTGKDLGVVSANVSIAFLSELLEQNFNIPGGSAFFINKDGLYVIHLDEQSVFGYSFFEDFGLEKYRDKVLGNKSFTTIDKVYYLNSTHIPEADWFLVTIVPTEVIYATTNRLIVQFVLLNAALLIIAIAVTVVLLRVLHHDRNEIIKANRSLIAERDEIAAMKDNLRTGVFLMDKDNLIQPNYSHSLEQIFPVDLYKKKFTDILSASFSPHDLEIVKDFFEMVRTRARPQNQLDCINPFDELVYTSKETHEVKTLRCRFVPVERDGDIFLLGTVDDVTEETRLRKKLEEEATKRHEEMRLFFEVVHVEPTVLMTFTEDATYNLDEGLTLLQEAKSAEADSDAILVRLYQLIHAIKSDAYIIGLSVYGDKLHNLESEIKRLRDRSESAPMLTHDDVSRLIAQVEEMESEKDKFFNIVVQYATASHQKQEEVDVLIASLKRACERVAADLDKMVRFEPAVIEPEAVKVAPYRQLKAILVQLVRNAIYHGIETPEQRSAAGKDETGVIRFSLQRQGASSHSPSGMLRVTIQDDGIGLNFDKIQRKAIARGLSEEDANDRNKLLRALFQPGFSTAETEGAHAGRGIGLNLVQDEVHALHGSIEVRTEHNKGTAFIITIPLHTSA